MGAEEGVPQSERRQHPGAHYVRVVVTQRSGHDPLEKSVVGVRLGPARIRFEELGLLGRHGQDVGMGLAPVELALIN